MGFSVAIVARGRSLEKCESKLMGLKKKKKKKSIFNFNLPQHVQQKRNYVSFKTLLQHMTVFLNLSLSLQYFTLAPEEILHGMESKTRFVPSQLGQIRCVSYFS